MFVVIDGPDGAGKTTLARRVVLALCALGVSAHYTHEPSDSMIGRDIREYLRTGNIVPDKLLDLFLEDRRLHLSEEVMPMLARGVVVVCDRYKYSTVCYQHLQGFALEHLVALNGFLSPDVAFLVRLSADTAVERIRDRGRSKDIFEVETLVQKSVEVFAKMHELFPEENIQYLDGLRQPDSLEEEVTAWILQKLAG
jgi:dTMP kinase